MASEVKEVKPLEVSVKKFGDVYNSATPWEVTHKVLKDKDIIIRKASKIPTSYGPSFLADVEVDGGMHKVLIGGKVLIQQLEDVINDLPLSCKIIKVGRYYTFS